MRELSLEITMACNLSCRHCLRDFSNDCSDIPADLIPRVLDEAKLLGAQEVVLTGGEPLLYHDLEGLIGLISEKSLRFRLVTNGTDILQLLSILDGPTYRQALNIIAFSLEGDTEDVHDGIRGKGSFMKLMQSVTRCRAKRIPFGFGTVIGSHNHRRIDQIGLLASHLGAEMISFSHMHPTPANWRHDLVLPLTMWRDAEQDVLRLAKTLKMKVFACNATHHADPLYPCQTMQMESMHVDNQGNLIFCCSLSHYRNECGGPRREILGNLREMSLFEGTRRMLDKVKALQLIRLERIEQGRMRSRDYHPCLVCHDFFGNLDWWEKEER